MKALKSNSEFVVTDTSESLDLAGRKSIVAFDLRTVICIPLRKPQVQSAAGGGHSRVPARPWARCTWTRASLRTICRG